MKPNLTPILLSSLLALVLPSRASVSLYAEYHLGEAGSLGATNLPIDSSGNGKNFTSNISGGTTTTATSGVTAPGSTTCLDTSGTGNEGWFSSNLFSTAPALATDNFAFGVYARAASNSSATQGDVFTIGGNNGAFKVSLDTNGWAASSHNLYWIGTSGGTSGSYSANTWVHLAIIRSAGVSTFYINGVAQSGTISSAPVIDTPHLSVNPGGSKYFDGQVDEARVVTFTAGETTSNILSLLQNGVMADPVMSLASGSYIGDQSITISDTTPGVTMHYTTDGSTPTSASPVYSAPILLTAPSTTVVKAIAVRSGMPDSAVVTQTYTLIAGSTGIWSNTAGGSWNTSSNWQSSAIPSGVGITADFSTLDLTAAATVSLDGSRTIGHLIFSDTTPDSNWALTPGSGGTLTLATATGSPSIAVTNQTATVSTVIAGTQGLSVTGAGKLILTGTNTYTGGSTVNAESTLQIGVGGTAGSLAAGNLVINGLLDYNLGTSSTISLPTGSAISGTGSLSALANIVRMNGNITLGGAITLRENGSANNYFEGLELASSSTLTASAITLYGNLGKQGSNGNTLNLDTSAANGPISLQISTGLGNVWYTITSVTANAGTGTITVPGVGPGGPWAFVGAVPSWLAPTSLRGAVQITGNVPAGAPVTIETTAASEVSGILSGVMTLTKNGASTLTLSSANTYTGATSVNAGTLIVTGSMASASNVAINHAATLSGTGTIGGAVTLVSDSTLSPGVSSIGTLTINNSLTMNAASTVVMELNNDGGIATNDLVTGLTGTLTYAGTLNVINTTSDSTALAIGDKFILFTKATAGYAGEFTTLNLPTLPAGMRWETGSLLTDGSIEVQNALVASTPVFSQNSGTYVGVQSIAITAEPGATIHYTTDGSTPTSGSPVYTSAVSIPVNVVTTLKAISVRAGYADSSVNTGVYTVWSTPTWLSTVEENWETSTNWSNAFIPNAPGFPVDFNTLDLVADTRVLIDNPITIGSMVIGDTSPSHNWILDNLLSAPITLAVNSGSPVIDVVNQTTTVLQTVVGTQGLTKTGAGTLAFNGANTYSGNTVINQGTLVLHNSYVSDVYQIAAGAVLEMNVASGLADRSGATISGGGTLRKTGSGTLWWYSGALDMSLASGGLIDVQAGTLVAGDDGNDLWTANQSDLNVASGAIFNGRDAEVHVNGINGSGQIYGGYAGIPNAQLICGVANGNGTFSGVISNVSSTATCKITKLGSGTQILSGNNNYTGTTTVNGGTLVINGNQSSATGVVTINNSGTTLAGVGTIGGNTTLNADTVIAPGSNSVATLNFNSNLTLEAGSNYRVEVSGATTSDKVALSSGKTLTCNGTITLVPSGHALSAGDSYDVADASVITGTPTLSPASPGTNLAWDTSEFLTTGVIKVVSTVVDPYINWASVITDPNQRGKDQDPDGDGFTNLQEFLFGSSPITPTGALTTTEKTADSIVIRWQQREAGCSYQLLDSAALADDWVPNADAVIANDGTAADGYQPVKATIPLGAGKKFFRVVGVEN